jgi:hypothetical protein
MMTPISVSICTVFQFLRSVLKIICYSIPRVCDMSRKVRLGEIRLLG